MFLFERIFGVGIYMVTLLVFCMFLLKTNVSCKSVLRIYLLCLCIMAFFYKPYTTADLYRIFQQMDYFKTMNFDLFWNNFAVGSPIPISRLLFWFFGKIGVNALLPMFSALACYSMVFYVVNKTKDIFDISNQTVAIVLFFIMTTSIYISVIGGIRMMLALSIITFSYYRANVEKKVTVFDIFFCIISIFVHEIGIVIICICIFALLIDSSKNILRKVGYILGAGALGGIFFTRFNDMLHGLYQKFLEYVLGEKHSDSWEYVMGVIIVLILLLMFVEFRRVCNDEECSKIKKNNLAAIISVIVAVCFCFEFSIFYRFGAHIAVLFSIPSLMVSLEKTKGRPSSFMEGMDFGDVIVKLSLINAAISCARGSLCSLKFFEL